MASPLHDHWDWIVQLRRKNKSYTDIAAELTKQGIPITANNLSNFYKRKLKTIRKIRAELAVLDSDVPSHQETKQPPDLTSSYERSNILSAPPAKSDDSKITIKGPDDPWKPKVVRPPKKRSENEEPKPKNKWDDFVVGLDVLQ